MVVVTSEESRTLIPSVASVLEELLLLGSVVLTLCFKGKASDVGSLIRGQALGGFSSPSSDSSHPLPKLTTLSCLQYAHLLRWHCFVLVSCSTPILPLCRAHSAGAGLS